MSISVSLCLCSLAESITCRLFKRKPCSAFEDFINSLILISSYLAENLSLFKTKKKKGNISEDAFTVTGNY